ncbi:hypothetical protein PD5205_03137 [Xanthomonas fragariae]|uniref:Uncharacterized protein n=1 Tax=Xanthomonas fragariae TaxID=48664 RepID=A0A1Y6GWC3_9XANT|nr:hypothetical protein NBC2815_00892 [Xanthomonas fragariae]SMQ98117.1 hypothetical protein PD885_00858 [Xanthomonas fragariae]SMR04419.1 hypothetical protein PD5205_03137 [Xanthomonas fragariae]
MRLNALTRCLKHLPEEHDRKGPGSSEGKPSLQTHLLSEEIEGYISDLKRRKVTLTHIQSSEQTLGIMLAVVEDKTISSITSTDIRNTLDN